MHRHLLRIGLVAVLLAALLQGPTSRSTLAHASTDQRAVALVRSAIERMGGDEKLRSLKSVQIETIGHTYSIEQSERPVRIYLNSQTDVPTAIEFDRSYPGSFIWGSWGDVKSRTYLSLWTLESGGIRFPHQWDIERNGIPYQSFTVTSLTLNPSFDNNVFSISAETRKAYEASARRTIEDTPLGQPNRPPVEIAPGVFQIPGAWNVTLVRQSDGVVVIEAPISSGYSDKVLADARKRFPDLPIKAVVSTSDAWPWSEIEAAVAKARSKS